MIQSTVYLIYNIKDMYKILEKQELNSTVTRMKILAPLVASKALPGQFIILRVSDKGERIPLTISDYDREEGSISIIFQIVGATTLELNNLNVGDSILDFVGPLGNPTNLEGVEKVCIIGGGVGCAIALPIAKYLKSNNKNVTSIVGFKNKDLIILEDDFKKNSDRLIVTTDDGSYGVKGNVTGPLKELLLNEKFDKVITIGPLIMMKFVVATCKEFHIPCDVSMNPIMIDGTGMCGGCRLTLNIDGQKVTKFACVDGPDFNGYEIDFDEAMSRNAFYREQERKAYDDKCNLLKGSK